MYFDRGERLPLRPCSRSIDLARQGADKSILLTKELEKLCAAQPLSLEERVTEDRVEAALWRGKYEAML